MKIPLLPIVLVTAAMLMSGCQPATKESPPVMPGTLAAVQEKTDDAAKDMHEYTFAQKGEFVENMQIQLDSIKHDLDRISSQIATASDTVKAEDTPKLKALRDRETGLELQLQKVKDADASTWYEVTAGFRKNYDDLKTSVAGARQRMSEKIAP